MCGNSKKKLGNSTDARNSTRPMIGVIGLRLGFPKKVYRIVSLSENKTNGYQKGQQHIFFIKKNFECVVLKDSECQS